MTIDEEVAVFRAWREGKKIEYRTILTHEWMDCDLPSWRFDIYDYRVKAGPREWQVAIVNGKVKMPVEYPCDTPYEIVTVREVT